MILSPGDIVADKYRIERFIGEGGMGTVYAAVNQLTGRKVALKWLRTDLSTNEMFAQRFMREARVSGRLDHPNIVNVYDVGRHRGTIFMVMELLRGEPFDAWIRRAKPPPAECIARLMPALRAVAAAHALGVIHRDLKPEHVYLCRAGDGTSRQTKVLDFGIAKELGGADSNTSLTSPGSLIGTVHYMAPEQVRNSRHVDVRSDVYSLGVILYSALGGGLPYDAESIAELILKVAEAKPESLARRNPKLPKKLVDVVMKAMSKDPTRRYQTVADLARALEPFSGGVPFAEPRAEASLPPDSPSTPPPAEPAGLKPTTTMVSTMGKRSSMPHRTPKWTTLALIVLPLTVFVLVVVGSSLLSSPDRPRADPAVATTSVGLPGRPKPAPAASASQPARTPTPEQAPAQRSSATPSVTPVVTAGTAVNRQPITAPPARARATRATSVAPTPAASTAAFPHEEPARPPPPQPAASPPASDIEHNPYLRH